jgi:cell division protein FtsB
MRARIKPGPSSLYSQAEGGPIMAKRRSKNRKFLILLIFLIFIISLLPGSRGILNQIHLYRQQLKLRDEIEQLTETKKQLEEKKEKLQESETVEKFAREKYGMAKKNEKVYQVVPEEKKDIQ